MNRVWISAAAGVAIGLGFAASAQAAPEKQSTPKEWKWALDSKGNPVRKGNVVKNPDGSVRETFSGRCSTVKETSPGAVRTKSSCSKPR